MSDAVHSDAAQVPADIWASIEQLRQQGAEQRAALGFHYLSALAQRAASVEGHARRLLDAKLAAALAACSERLLQTQHAANDASTDPDQTPVRETLGDLARAFGQHGEAADGANPLVGTSARSELKTVQKHRNTWSKLSAEKQLSKALEKPPSNPGPINSHMLVLRSVALMRDTSPDYVSRFMTYVDTLLVLQQNDAAKPSQGTQSPGTDARAKPKLARAPSRKPASPKQ